MHAKFIASLMALSLLSSCGFGRKKNKPKDPQNSSQQLLDVKIKAEDYCLMSLPLIQDKGFVHSRGDAALFTSLRAVGCGDTDISTFMYKDQPGRYNRAPEKAGFVKMPDDPDADSTDSKDMAVGRAIYFWERKDKAALEAIVAYGKAHTWMMCEAKTLEAKLSKCQWSIGLIKIHLDMLDKLNGAPIETSYSAEKPTLEKELAPENQTLELYGLRTHADLIPINTGFRAHLDVLMAYLRGQVYGAIDDSDLDLLRAQAKRQPRNALFAAVKALYEDGNQTPAITLLMDEKKFPNASLPSAGLNYCTEYLYQRDDASKDWEPCAGENEPHSGTDLIFAARVIYNQPLTQK